jgi:hypothetical protein
VGAAAGSARAVTALLLDEMLSGAIAEQLRDRDIDAVAVVEDAALVGTSDEDLLAHATAQQRVLVTANIGDFAAIATDWRADGRTHAGTIYVTYRSFPQDRSFVGALVSSLATLHDTHALPSPGTEAFLRRA